MRLKETGLKKLFFYRKAIFSLIYFKVVLKATSDDDINLIVVSLMGTDCATLLVQINWIIGGLLLLTQQGTSKKVTLMTSWI